MVATPKVRETKRILGQICNPISYPIFKKRSGNKASLP